MKIEALQRFAAYVTCLLCEPVDTIVEASTVGPAQSSINISCQEYGCVLTVLMKEAL